MNENVYLGAIKLTGEPDLMYVKIIADSEDEADEKLSSYLDGREIEYESYEIISGEEIDFIG